MSEAEGGGEGGGESTASVDTCQALPGDSNMGKIAGSLVWRVAAAAAAVAQSAATSYISGKQFEIAKMMLNIARFWRDWYRTMFIPLEDKELDELYALPFPVPHYATAIGRGKATVRYVLKNALNKTMRCTSQYDTGLRSRIVKETVMAEGSAVALGAAAGYRMERDRVDKLTNSHWERFHGVINRGRDIAAVSVNYGRLANNIYGGLSDLGNQAAGGLMELSGYFGERRLTDYGGGVGNREGFSGTLRAMEMYRDAIERRETNG